MNITNNIQIYVLSASFSSFPFLFSKHFFFPSLETYMHHNCTPFYRSLFNRIIHPTIRSRCWSEDTAEIPSLSLISIVAMKAFLCERMHGYTAIKSALSRTAHNQTTVAARISFLFLAKVSNPRYSYFPLSCPHLSCFVSTSFSVSIHRMQNPFRLPPSPFTTEVLFLLPEFLGNCIVAKKCRN